jgi:hypothetical protein
MSNSKQEHEVNQNERHKDTRFLPEVRPPTKDAYVSVVELTKSRVAFNPNPLRTITKIESGFHYQIPTMERAIQTFWG